VRVRLPDGSEREHPAPVRLIEVAEGIGRRLAKDAIAALVDGKVLDLQRVLDHDAAVRILTAADKEALEVLRHSSAHLLAQAVKRLFPEARFGVGPVIENGFYYDIDVSRSFTPEDLSNIEKEIARIAQENLSIERMEWSREEALAWARERADPYKLELIEAIPQGETISLYRQGEFVDLCTGPHLPSTGFVRHLKLLSVAGAYFRGDEKRPMLQRIYGTAFFDQKALDEYLHMREEAERRDHRRLGKALDLFFFHPLAPASPFFLPKGALLYNLLIAYLRELYRELGFQEVITPQLFQSELWKTSGHYDNYKEHMFFCEADGVEYGVKPMNCPGHMLMFASKVRSYRELPLRLADFGRLHRYERSGVLRGLTRVRSFAQDDAHIFIAPEMLAHEFDHGFTMVRRIYTDLGLPDPKVTLGTRPEKAVGDRKLWDDAERSLTDVLTRRGVEFIVNPGDGAFYGPKIDFITRDAIGHEHQLTTMQLDFNLPERFDLKYSSDQGTLCRPVVIHRAILGSIERFLGVYIEHTAGAFPVWLCPVQAKVLSVAQDFNDDARKVERALSEAGIRTEVDDQNDKIGAKVRTASLEKVPYLLVVGARERDAGTVAVRQRGNVDLGSMTVPAFATLVQEMVRSRKALS